MFDHISADRFLLAVGNGTWVALLLASLAGSVALYVYASNVLRKYIRIAINIIDDVAFVPPNGKGEEGDPPGELVHFRAADGHSLEGRMHQGMRSRAVRSTIIFAHEFGSDRTSCLNYCRALIDGGFDVFAFDFRGHGASPSEEGYQPRQWATDREQADMLGAIAYVESLHQEQGESRNIGLYGISRGGAAAILATAGLDNVGAVVTDGAFSSDHTLEYLIRRFATIFARIRVVAENHHPLFWRFLRWLLFRECRRRFNCRFLSVRKAIRRLGNRPILMIHGEKDSYVPVALARALYDQAPGPKTLWIVPGAKHNQCVLEDREEYSRRLLSFFVAHLSTDVEETIPIVEVAKPQFAAAVEESLYPPMRATALIHNQSNN